MSMNKGPCTSPKVSGPIESSTAAKQPSLTAQGIGHDDHDAMIAALRAQLASFLPPARVLAAIGRELWTEAIVACPGCGRAHRHHIGHDEDRPVVRRGRCGAGQTTTYVIDPDGAL
jgi:hypothetical protein